MHSGWQSETHHSLHWHDHTIASYTGSLSAHSTGTQPVTTTTSTVCASDRDVFTPGQPEPQAEALKCGETREASGYE